MTYDAGDLVHLETAESMAEAARVLMNRASTVLRIVHERHPLFYRANQILRNLDELQTDLRRERDR